MLERQPLFLVFLRSYHPDERLQVDIVPWTQISGESPNVGGIV